MRNKKWMTLIEIIIVIVILLFLIWVLYPSFSGIIWKQKDVGRANVLKEYLVYFDTIKQSTGQYPTDASRSRLKTGSNLKNILGSDLVPTATYTSWYEYLFTFNEQDPATGLYAESGTWWLNGQATKSLSGLQKLLLETQSIWSYGSIKAGLNDEGMIIFTSITWKQAVGCTKFYGPQESATNDGDGIEDTLTGADSHKNGNRIFVTGDMGLWAKLGNDAKQACQEKLPDPSQL